VGVPGLEPGTRRLRDNDNAPDFWSQYFAVFLARILQKPPCITTATLSRIVARPIRLAATPRGSAHTETGSALRAPRSVAGGSRPVLEGARHRRAQWRPVHRRARQPRTMPGRWLAVDRKPRQTRRQGRARIAGHSGRPGRHPEVAARPRQLHRGASHVGRSRRPAAGAALAI
jgi:hypothetical protein